MTKPRIVYRPRSGFFWRFDFIGEGGILHRHLVGPFSYMNVAYAHWKAAQK